MIAVSTTRRQFVVQAAAGLAALNSSIVKALPAESAAAPGAIALGFSLYGMKSLPTTQALEACKSIGYDSVELVLMPGWSTAPEVLSAAERKRLVEQLKSLGLTVAALMENLTLLADEPAHQTNLERLRRACELAGDFNPQSPPVIETVLGGKPAEWEQVKHAMRDRLATWADVASKAHCTIAIKPHVSGALHMPEGATWLREQVASPAIKLAYDYSHYRVRGLDLTDTLRMLAPQTVFVHVKDVRGDAAKFNFLLPGEGDIDYVDYLKQLHAANYRGHVVVEVSGQIHSRADYDPLSAARRSYTHLAAAFEKAGVGRPR